MAKLYGDENFDHQVIAFLRALGHEVLTAQDAGRAHQRIPDEEVLSFATSQNHAVRPLIERTFLNYINPFLTTLVLSLARMMRIMKE